MTKKFKELKLTKDTTFNESIEVEGDITCEGARWTLKVVGNINAKNIDAWNINAGNINAKNIDAWNIICEKVKLKYPKKGKIVARSVLRNRSQLEMKEWESD